MKNLVVLSIYDGGYEMSFMVNEEIIYLDNYEKRERFEKRFGKAPDKITIEELSKHYSSDYIIVICEDGTIEYSRGRKEWVG